MRNEYVPRHVEDYVNRLSELRRDTGLVIQSYDWSEPMIEDENGVLYLPTWNLIDKKYDVTYESRQGMEIEAAGGYNKYVANIKKVSSEER
jgi:hypothetical protein